MGCSSGGEGSLFAKLFMISIELASLNSFQFAAPRSQVGATAGDLTAQTEVSFETLTSTTRRFMYVYVHNYISCRKYLIFSQYIINNGMCLH